MVENINDLLENIKIDIDKIFIIVLKGFPMSSRKNIKPCFLNTLTVIKIKTPIMLIKNS